MQPSPKHIQLGLTHGALQAEKQAIIEDGCIVEPILIEDEGLGERTHLEQAVPSGHNPAFDVSLDAQIAALTQAGCARIHTDAISDRVRPRIGWKDVLAYVSAGDTLVVWRLDRLAESQSQVLEIIAALHVRHVGLLSLTEPFSATSTADDLVVHHVGALATYPQHATHPEDPSQPMSQRVRRAQTVLFGLVVLGMIGLVYLFCFQLLPSYDTYTGHIVGVRVTSTAGNQTTQSLTVRVTSGNLRGKIYAVPHTYPTGFATDGYSPGDSVLLDYNPTSREVFVDTYDRRGPTFVLLLLLLGLILLVARRQGLLSLISMAVSVVVIMFFVIPNVLLGRDPLLYAIISACVIIPTTYYLARGFNRKTSVAIVATVVTLACTFALAALFVQLMKLPLVTTADEAAAYYTPGGVIIGAQSLYLAALVIGALAVLNDITVSQASVVTSLHRSNPALGLHLLVLRAMEVGTDHIASLINTLLLVYVGASFTLMRAVAQGIYSHTFGISDPAFSADLVRTVIMSIAVVLAVPISTYIAAYLALQRKL